MLLTIIYFLLILTGVVVVHELGHYLFLKLFRVRVLEFAIGMGPKIWSKKGKETTFRINVLPIGGYVRPAGEDLDVVDNSVPESAQIQNKPAWQRFIIYFAGPAFSIILGFIILSIVSIVWGFQEIKIDKVEPGSPAAIADIRPGDRIVSVNGRILIDNTRLGEAIKSGNPLNIVILRDGVEIGKTFSPELLAQEAFMILRKPEGSIGKKLIAINGGSFKGDFVGYSKLLSPESRIRMEFEDGEGISGTLAVYSPTEERYAIGIYYANFKPLITKDHGIFRSGDVLLSVGGIETKTSYDLTIMSQLLSIGPEDLMIQYSGSEVALTARGLPEEIGVLIERNGALLELDVSKSEMISLVSEAGIFAQGSGYWYPDSVFQAAALGLQWANSILITMVRVVGSLFTGKTNLNEFTGPIGLVTVVNQAVSLGLRIVIFLTGFISLNLGVVNMIPFPALDGGRMLLALLEMITRRRMDPKIEGLINVIGFMILMGLMIYITFVDIGRWL